MDKKIKILYVGSLNPNSNSYMRFITLQKMGHEATGINIDPYIYNGVFKKLQYHLNWGPGIRDLNKAILKEVIKITPQIILVDNKPYLTPYCLKKIKQISPRSIIVSLITDDPFGQYKRSWILFRRTIPLYDIYFVQRDVNVEELKALGANRVELCFRSFSPDFHRPILFSEEEVRKYCTPVGFIGTYAPEREEFIAFLIKNSIPVRIIGDGWQKGKHWGLIQSFYQGPSVYGEEYIRVINGFDIALHFLRHENRDQQDSRTFELPACRVFMLAEWSDLHETFFKDGEEVVFFKTKEELLEKVNYYLKHVEERINIAQSGYHRSISSSYHHEGRLREVILKALKIKKW